MRFLNNGRLLSLWSLKAIVLPLGLFFFANQTAYAQDYPAFSEFRLGVLASDLEPGGESDDGAAISGEFLTPRRNYEGMSVFDRFLSPRVHVGGVVSLDDGVNQAYAGLTWDVYLTDRIFLEASFGGAIHDGNTADNDPDSYGCALNFRESFGVGMDLTDRISILAKVDHMSNAGLCGENQGLTNAGVQLGYKW